MLLSEMFGVERETDFMVKSHSRIHRIRENLLYGRESIYVKVNENQWVELYDAPTIFGMIAAGPDCIIHLPPPLTDEQREQLRAIWTLGYSHLAKDKYGSVYAYEIKPCKKTRDTWSYEDGDSHLCCTKPTKCLESLVSWSDPEPFDIGKALGVGE